MAQVLLADRLAAAREEKAQEEQRPAASVRSAGLLAGDGRPPPPEVVAAMAAYDLDVTGHRSHQVTAADLEQADLVLAMGREHLRHAVVTAPAVWPRAFTLRELVRRGAAIGPRKPGESLGDWLARAHHGRQRADLLGDSAEDDVADPIGGPPAWYAETAATLGQLVDQLAELCWRPGT